MFVWCWTYTINFFFCSTYIFSYVTLWPTTSGGFPWLRTCFVIIFTAITSKNHTTHHDSIPEFYLLFKILSFSPSLLPALPFPMCVCVIHVVYLCTCVWGNMGSGMCIHTIGGYQASSSNTLPWANLLVSLRNHHVSTPSPWFLGIWIQTPILRQALWPAAPFPPVLILLFLCFNKDFFIQYIPIIISTTLTPPKSSPLYHTPKSSLSLSPLSH